jgi:hypothetical protein
MSESLTLQQLKDIKELARQMGATASMGTTKVPNSNTFSPTAAGITGTVNGSQVSGNISGTAAGITGGIDLNTATGTVNGSQVSVDVYPAFSSGSTYQVDDFVERNGEIFRALSSTTVDPASTAPGWDSTEAEGDSYSNGDLVTWNNIIYKLLNEGGQSTGFGFLLHGVEPGSGEDIGVWEIQWEKKTVPDVPSNLVDLVRHLNARIAALEGQ